MIKETKLLLEIAGWCVEHEVGMATPKNTHTDNIKQLVGEIYKGLIKENEDATPELDKAIAKLESPIYFPTITY